MKKNLFVLMSLFLIFSCAGMTDQPDSKTVAKFSGEKTFAWLVEGVPGDDVRVNNPRVKRIVESSLEKEMIRKGYQKAGPSEADLLISWFGSVDEEVKEMHMSSFYRSYGYSTLKGSRPETLAGKDGKVEQVFTRGTLIVDVLDPKSKALIWRETATNTILKKMSDAELAQYIDTSVKNILGKMPDAGR